MLDNPIDFRRICFGARCLLLLLCVVLAYAQSAAAQYAYGLSDVFHDKRSGATLGLSVTELDYTAALYYKVAVTGSLYENDRLAARRTQTSGEFDFRAVVWTEIDEAARDAISGVYSDHFVEAYFHLPPRAGATNDGTSASANEDEKRWYDPLGFEAYGGSYNLGWHGFRGSRHGSLLEKTPYHHLGVTFRGWHAREAAR